MVRLTPEPDSASFYFNVNGYTPDGKEMAYTAPDGIYALDLTTLKTRQVVQGHVFAIQAGFKTPSVFYVKTEGEAAAPATPQNAASAKRALYVTNMDTGETRKLVDLPPRAMVSTINADQTLAAGTYIEGTAGEGQPYAGPSRPREENPHCGQQPQGMLQR